MKAVDAATMRSLDRRAIEEAGIPGEILMERAGYGLSFETVLFASKLPPRHARRFVILAGKGNNGGDAFVAARLLREMNPGMALSLHCACKAETLSGDAAKMFARIPKEIKDSASFDLKDSDLREGDIIIDGLLGSGLSGEPRPPFQQWIDIVNASSLPVIAIDIPSGLDADSGKVLGCAIEADLTVTMALPKTGFFKAEGKRLSGRLRVIDIGFPKGIVDEAHSSLECITAHDIRRLFRRENFDTYKNERGHLLVIGGSRLYPGAPALSASSALKAGAGLVTLAIPEGAAPHGLVPNAIIARRLANNGAGILNESSLPVLRELLAKANAIALGPGLSTEPSCASIVKIVVESGKPCVFDADALNLIAANPSLAKGLDANSILTPHPGEMRRLASAFGLDSACANDRESVAKALAQRTGSTVILKGCRSIVASPSGELAVNSSGCAALATAGSGDILTGLAAALLSRGLKAFDAAKAATFIHGLAGELACPCGSKGLIADELPAFIAEAFKEISPLI